MARARINKEDEYMSIEICPICGDKSKYPGGGVCKGCYAKLKEEGYWAMKWAQAKKMGKIGRCPICGGRLARPEPVPGLVSPDYECVTCQTQIWLPEDMGMIGKTLDSKFFFLHSPETEVLPWGPPKKSTGGSRAGSKRGKNKGTKKYIEPWKLE